METDNHPFFRTISILIIDDDTPTLELYAGEFQKDYHVYTSTSWHDAMDILASQHLQLVILEPAMAGSQGWRFLKEITQTYNLPVIVCSALDDRKSGLEAGAAAYLVKPVLPTTLREVLKSILN